MKRTSMLTALAAAAILALAACDNNGDAVATPVTDSGASPDAASPVVTEVPGSDATDAPADEAAATAAPESVDPSS